MLIADLTPRERWEASAKEVLGMPERPGPDSSRAVNSVRDDVAGDGSCIEPETLSSITL
jgi:hypothetical protein